MVQKLQSLKMGFWQIGQSYRGWSNHRDGLLSTGLTSVSFVEFLGYFPEGMPAGKMCLLLHLKQNNELKDNRDYRKTLIVLALSGVAYLIMIYLQRRQKRFFLRLCPHQKMSCVGKFKRNVMDYYDTFYLALFYNVFSVFVAITNEIFRILDAKGLIEPKYLFIFNCFYWLMFTEIPLLWLTFKVHGSEGLIYGGTYKKAFYISKLSLIPRRCQLELSFSHKKHEHDQKNSFKNDKFSITKFFQEQPRLRHGQFGLVYHINSVNKKSQLRSNNVNPEHQRIYMDDTNISYTSNSPYNRTNNSPSMDSTTTILTDLNDLRPKSYLGKGKGKGKGKSNTWKHEQITRLNGNDANGYGSSRNAIYDSNTLVTLPSSSLYLPQVE